MGRPPLPVGTYGGVDYTVMGPRKVRARARVRDYDGRTRPVTRYGPSRAAAERRLKEALRDRIGPTGGDITADMKISRLAVLWLEEITASDLADGSKQLYETDLNQKVVPAMGELSIRESDVPACDRFLKAVRANSGVSKARTCRTVLSLLMQLAVRHGAIKTNPVREVAKIPSDKRSKARALTVEQQGVILDKIGVDQEADLEHDDLADLAEVLDGTGMRIGEALGIRVTSFDLDAGVLEVNATVIRLKKVGTVLQERPKSEAGWRVIALPPNVVAVLKRRRVALGWPGNELGLLFPTKSGGPRNPSNTNRDLKATLVRIDSGFAWVTSHTFRKTVATRMDESGLSARAIAEHLGHSNPSMTMDVYMGRGVAVAEAATILGRAA
ncbi:site-specific integrase [Kribbella solani]|uniref:site-specific integrase n=1 Tax=Kribbella solani TaxID=236067 RepID=UPI0029A05D21|nr:site-specific integrase [Kribbella solani]MDX3006722.1 site-specific integrase [Kribbella solani]